MCEIDVIESAVDQLANNLKHYLSEVAGDKVTVNLMDSGDLPHFLKRQYALYRLMVGNVAFTAVFLRHEDELKPAQFIKHMSQIPSILMDDTCIVAYTLPTYVRKRLIEKGIAFVLPKIQMYLPALGMDLRARAGHKRSVAVERFSPSAQVVLIAWLLGKIEGNVTAQDLSKQLGYSAMSMSRVINELESTQVAEIERIGRERVVSFTESHATVWQKALPRLRNPVSKMVRISEQDLHRPDALPAGVTALSLRSMLGESTYPEYAVSRDVWKAMEKAGVKEIPLEEPGTCMLQVWRYDPKLLVVDGQVDPFSLYLSLQGEADERIEMALDQMMEQYL